ncbi:RtcB family protein [Candidatus Pacearchaeota archaeon]|nr:RtcB family protein [Candidatus Pacearchaeota archaeon]
MKIKKIAENIWEIEKEEKMNVPGIVFASDSLMEKIKLDKTLEQVNNVAFLQGIVEKSIAMPDAHQGYGFCVGGVAAFDIEKGIISPGGIGYDINCGVRLLATNLKKEELLRKREQVLDELFKNVPSGVGHGGEFKLNDKELDEVLNNGSKWALKKSYATEEDIKHTEDNGCIAGADASKVSQKAKSRGRNQLGTLGAGNHFVEVQEVNEIFNKEIAKIFGLNHEEQIVILIHTGSRGLGHQTASDYIKQMEKEYGFKDLPDRELACAPIGSKLGKEYRSAMASAANFAFTNRQIITHQIRKSFAKYFPKSEIKVVYDIAHNIAKFEEFEINGEKKVLCVHRKGATRSFGPGRKEIPEDYRPVGCPIFIPGSMGTFSYVLVGTNKAREISFASTAHGAGRLLSRTFAKKNISAESLKQELKEKDIAIKAGSVKGMIEEAPEAYKDVNEVVKVSHELGIGNLVAKLKPLAVMKG